MYLNKVRFGLAPGYIRASLSIFGNKRIFEGNLDLLPILPPMHAADVVDQAVHLDPHPL